MFINNIYYTLQSSLKKNWYLQFFLSLRTTVLYLLVSRQGEIDYKNVLKSVVDPEHSLP